MNEVITAIERELMRAARRRAASRRAPRHRAPIGLAVAGAVLVAVSAASAVSGEGPLADLFGVRRDDPNLRIAEPKRGGQRAIVVAQSESGQRWRFGIFQTSHPFELPGRPPGERVFCFTPVPERAERLTGLGCGPAKGLLKQIRRKGFYFTPYGSGSHGESSGVLAISPVWGLVPADAQGVQVIGEDGQTVEATLSEPFVLRVGQKSPRPDTRAFLAVLDLPGDLRLRGFTRITAEATLADGAVRRRSAEVAVGFPLVRTSKPDPGSKRLTMGTRIGAQRWETLSYEGARGSLCTSAAPAGEPLIKLTRLQCSSPLAIVDALERFGVATYPSESEPPGGGKRPGSYVVRGFARADARKVVVIDQRGRTWTGRISRVWTTIARAPNDTSDLEGRFRQRFDRLPQQAPVRSFVVAIPTPPGPSAGDGVRLRVRLADATELTQP